MPILLTATGFSTKAVVNVFLEELAIHQRYPAELNVCIVTTAAKERGNNCYVKKTINQFLKMGFLRGQVTLFDFANDPLAILSRAQVVYLNGGNPYELLAEIRKAKGDFAFRKLKEQEAFLIGTSAGAMVLGPTIAVVEEFTPKMNHPQLTDFTGLKLTDTAVFPHYDRDDLFGDNIEKRLSKFEKAHDLQLFRLKDGECCLLPYR